MNASDRKFIMRVRTTSSTFQVAVGNATKPAYRLPPKIPAMIMAMSANTVLAPSPSKSATPAEATAPIWS